MKVLSIRQPWASLIVYGYKKYEFRSWQTHYRGDLLIHASKGFEKQYIELFKDLNIPMESGKIIGKVTLEDCLEVTSKLESELIKENPKVYGQNKGRTGYAWKVSNPKLIKPISINGRLNLWDYDIDNKNNPN